ncbi:MAG: hypothetical protein V7642_1163 [Burkholderiales bacterium]|jgi:hypothetical protein
MTNKAIEVYAWRLAESGLPCTINHITLAGGMSRRQLSNRSRRTQAIHPM